MSDSELIKETRFAVVMYGGVSLAVYINGIAQELYRMVSATAEQSDGAEQPSVDTAKRTVWGTEDVYRKIRNKLKTRFVVDILSGTSAGGINGIFLAKALANGQSFKSLEQLWLDEGNIEVLINDKKSKDSGCKADVEYPRSLLNSERMYNHLLKAFDDMDNPPSGRDPTRGPLVDELDLYVTATDLQGFPVTLKLSDIVVSEKVHQNIFHFHFKKDSAEDNDFVETNNPFLAFAARCTSAFPFAFEPIRLQDLPMKINHPQWMKFYEKYLLDLGHCDAITRQSLDKTIVRIGDKYDLFTRRSFADGGYLDNKPFSYAINAITSRGSDVPVDRKLIYIEPSPDKAPDPCAIEEPPNAIENIGKVFSLATYETIQQDLRRVIDRNRLIERVNRILKGTTEDFPHKNDNPALASDWNKLYLKEMIGPEGVAYGGYLRLRVAHLTDDLTEIITRHSGFDVQSDFFLAVRYIIRVWRDALYEYDRDDNATVHKHPFNQFLFDYDMGFMIRRLSYTISIIDTVFPLIDMLKEKANEKALSGTESWNVVFGKIRKEYGAFFLHVVQPLISPLQKETLDHLNGFQERLRDIRREISERREAIYRYRDMLLKPGKAKNIPQEIQVLLTAIKNIGISPEEIVYKILGKCAETIRHLAARSETESYQAAMELIGTDDKQGQSNRKSQLDRVAKVIRQMVQKADEEVSWAKVVLGLGDISRNSLAIPATVEQVLNDQNLKEHKEFEHWANMLKPARLATWLPAIFFRRFMWYDEIAYPIIQFSGVGQELDEVEIIRISPDDAKSLSDGGARKLGGTTLMHFGAFLDRTWRKNDILWGRLDGAERIIKALMAGADEKTIKDLVKEAHLGIIQETFFERKEDDPADAGRLRIQETIDLLSQLALGKKDPDRKSNLVKVFSGQGEGGDSQKIVSDLLERAIHGRIDAQEIYCWLMGYEINKDINPRLALESITRSTQVIGKMLGVMSDDYGPLKRPAAWLTRLGAFVWGLVEAAVPESLLDLLTRKLTSLVTLIAVILIAGGIFTKEPALERMGIWLLLGALCFTLIKFYLRSYFLKKKRPAVIRRIINFLLAFGVFLVMGLGVCHLPEAWNWLCDSLKCLVKIFWH